MFLFSTDVLEPVWRELWKRFGLGGRLAALSRKEDYAVCIFKSLLRVELTPVLSYSRKQLYELVADVDAYHRFIPFCSSSTVLRSSRPDWKTNMGNDGDPPVNLEAELKVGFLGVDESYVSKVECRPFESVQVNTV